MSSLRGRLRDAIDRMVPWYDVAAEERRDRSLERSIAVSRQKRTRADAVIESYRRADGALRR